MRGGYMFYNKKKDKPQETAPQKEAQSWDDKLSSALPRTAQFFDAIRTDAYENNNLVANYVEFWVGLKVDQEQDKWRIMHYMIFNLDMADGKFKSEVVSKEDCTFPEAVYHISKFDSMASAAGMRAPLQAMEEKYPADQFPEMKVHFFDIEHYHLAANIEGIAFDEAGHPYRRVEGKIVSESTFKRSEVANPILAVSRARENPHVLVKIEGGILSDIFAAASDDAASLDKLLQVGEVLSEMDRFAACVGTFYLNVQRSLDQPLNFEKIGGLSSGEREAVFQRARSLGNKSLNPLEDSLRVLEEASECLDIIKEQGVHVEPFQKFVAECELYAYLLNASQKRKELEYEFRSVGNNSADLIVEIRRSVEVARNKFVQLGGTQEQLDKLNGWVANRNKENIPGWLPGFLTRYYETRGKIMQTVQDRKQALQKVNTMSAEVKPPLMDEFNAADASSGNAKPQEGPVAPRGRNGTSGPGPG